MAKDMIVKAIETILSGTPSKMGPRIKQLQNRLKKMKQDQGKPKGKSPSIILGSASKAGMQGKQGTGSLSIKRKPFQRAPNAGFPGKGPVSPAKKKGKEAFVTVNRPRDRRRGK